MNVYVTVLFFLCSTLYTFSQELGTIPQEVWRPDRSEALRYPQDMRIGEIGRGSAPESAYRFAQQFIEQLKESADYPSITQQIKGTNRVRVGGGREEPDGCMSFLFHFWGQEISVTGELYVRMVDNIWICDDVVLNGS
ncbi:MAG: hypothetical protein LBQ77_01800 [Treponema sp.]|nr:hypothetical protein [Treponema sp.]